MNSNRSLRLSYSQWSASDVHVTSGLISELLLLFVSPVSIRSDYWNSNLLLLLQEMNNYSQILNQKPLADCWVIVLNEISTQLNRYFALLILIFGIIGNLLNCFVLSQRVLRSNPCAVYFLVSSIVNLISLMFGLTTRILAGWQLDPTRSHDWICKLRTFTVFTSRTIAIWLIMLATVDRWLLSSLSFHRRQMSSLRNTRRGIITSCVLASLFYSHMIYCYEANRHDTPLHCYGKSIECRLVTDFIYAILTILIPLILMIAFCLMIVSNVHHLRVHAQTITILTPVIPSRTKELKLRKTDHQLLRMLLVQVVLLIIFYIPQAIQKFYITVRPFRTGTELEDTVKTFVYNVELLLAYVASGMPFYLYTLSGGTIFRQASIDLVRATYQKLRC